MPGQTINVFGAIFGISLPLISKSKAVRQMAGFWMINSHFGEFYTMILWELERVESLTRKHVPATPPCKGLIPSFLTPTLPCLLFLKFSWQSVF
jgi:hypothetical protein